MFSNIKESAKQFSQVVVSSHLPAVWAASGCCSAWSAFGITHLPLSVCGVTCLCSFVGHFLMIKGIEHIFMCLLNICIPYLVKCLFRSIVYFYWALPFWLWVSSSRILGTNTLSDRCSHVCVICVYILLPTFLMDRKV